MNKERTLLSPAHWRQISEETRIRLGRQGFYNTAFSERFFDILSYLLCPIFLKARISANFITFCTLVWGAISALIISVGTHPAWIIGLLIFTMTNLLDHIDGRVASSTHTATYYGYFIDGLTDAFVLCLFRFGLVISIYKQFHFSTLFILAMSVLILTPFYIFIYDKYAAFARRINQEKNTNIKPYVRNDHLKVPANLVIDLERVALLISLFHFPTGLWIYFSLNLCLEMGFIFYHIFCAYQQMRISNLEMLRS